MWIRSLALGLALAASASAQAPATKPKPTTKTDGGVPARPSEQSAQELGRRLFAALVLDQPALAVDVFFPRDAFSQVKAMQKPERYFDKLSARFSADLHALHETTLDLAQASFVKLELGKRGGFVRPGDEGNRLPYWAARHARLHYRVGQQVRSLEVRVLITWGERWYVIHLSEFH